MSMVDSQIPESYITDYDKAVDVAYASKDQRCLAVAARLVDTVLSGAAENSTLEADVALAGQLLGIYTVYPEAFRHVIKESETPDHKAMLDKVPLILQNGGLPLIQRDWATRRRTAEELDAAAETREQIAEALFDAMPSKDFRIEFDLRSFDYERKPIDVVMGLLQSADYYREEAAKQEEKTQRDLERYEADDQKMKTIIYMLENTWLELGTRNEEFREEAQVAFNNEATTLADLKKLWLKGRNLVVQDYSTRADEKQRAFDLILSGEAETYASQS